MADWTGYVGLGARLPQLTKKTGADFTGADGAANRTLAISTYTDGFEIWIDKATQHQDLDYTYNGTTLTILGNLDNSSNVNIQSFGTP